MRAVVVAAAVAFLVSLLCTPWAIRAFSRLRAGQPIRTDGPQTHLPKQGTPTMGGVVFIVAMVVAYVAGHLALTTLPAQQIAQVGPTMTALVLLGLFVFCGAIGFIDDFLKVRKRNSLGLSERGKLLAQLLIGVAFGLVALYFDEHQRTDRRQHHVVVRPGHRLAGDRQDRRGRGVRAGGHQHHQRGQPHRRAGRAGHGRVDHGARRVRADRVLAVPALVRR